MINSTFFKKINSALEIIWSNYPFLLSFFISLAAAFTGGYFRPQFQTIDDQGLIQAFSGTFIFDTPAPVTAYTSKIWGILNVSIYKLLPNFYVEPYVLLLYFVAFITLLYITYHIVISNNYTINSFLLLILLALWIYIPFFNKIQFTTISGLAIFGGVFGVLNSKKVLSLGVLLGGSLVIVGYLIRPTNMLVILPLSLFFILVNDFLMRSFKRNFIGYLKKFLFLAVLVFSIAKIDLSIHSQKERHFLTFYTFNAYINDFNILTSDEGTDREKYLKEMKPEGIELFQNWFYGHPVLFNESTDYSKLNLDVSKAQVFSFERIKINLSTVKNEVKRQLKYKNVYLTLLFVLLITIFSNSKVRVAILVNFAVLILSYLFFSALTKAIPFRVSYTMFSITIFMIVMQLFKSKEFAFNSILTKGMSIVMIVSLFYTAIYFWPLRNWKYKEINLELDENKFYFMHHDIPKYLHFDPLHFRNTLKANQKVHCTGSFSVLDQVHREFNGKRFEYFIDFAVFNPSEIIYLIPSDIYGEPFKKAFVGFVLAHYNLKSSFKPIKGKDNQYYLEINNSSL